MSYTPLKIGPAFLSLKPLQLIRAWKECAGPALLKQARFYGLVNDRGRLVLVLEVEDPLWRQELEYQARSIQETYNAKLTEMGFPSSELAEACEIRGPQRRNKPDPSLGTDLGLPFKPRQTKRRR